MGRVTAAPVGRSGGRPVDRRRRSLLGLGGMVLAPVLVLSACNAGQDAAVTPGEPDVAHVQGDVGHMALDVVFIESGAVVEAGASAPLRGDFTNRSGTPDELVSVSTPAAGSVELLEADGTSSAQSIPIPADGAVDAVNGVARLQLVDAYYPLAMTQLVPVTFEFSHAGQVTLDVPVAVPTAPAP
jgi:copper(I)-binding protein